MRTEIPFEQQLVYTIDEISQVLKVNRNTVYDLIDNGLLQSIILGRRKVTRKSLLKFLEEYDGRDINSIIACSKANIE